MKKPIRTDNKYWSASNTFRTMAYITDFEEYTTYLEKQLIKNKDIRNKTSLELLIKIDKFQNDMLIEIENNKYKENILDFKDINNIILELEYHKVKLFIAIRENHKNAIKEYIADLANILLALGNSFNIYNENYFESIESHELNTNNLILNKLIQK